MNKLTSIGTAVTPHLHGEPDLRSEAGVIHASPHQLPHGQSTPRVGVSLAELVAISEGGRIAHVMYDGEPSPSVVRALATVDLSSQDVGRRVVTAFEDGDATRPIVLGVVRDGADSRRLDHSHVQLDADGECLTIIARRQLVLRCGRASITLTSAGKVLIEGSYVSSRSSGVNRIKGGSIQLN